MSDTIVISMRDPDASNEFRTFGDPDITIIDVDFGRADLRNPDEFAEWRLGHLEQADRLWKTRTPAAVEAAAFLVDVIEQARLDFGHDG